MSFYEFLLIPIIVLSASIPFFVAFLIGETRRRIRVGHWR